MWWEAFDGESAELLRTVRRLTDLLIGPRAAGDAAPTGLPPAVWGIGSAPDEKGRWIRPLVVVNESAVREAGDAVAAGRYVLRDLLTMTHRNRLTDLLAEWDVPEDALVDVTGRPEAAADVHSTDAVRYAYAAHHATVGMPCVLRDSGSPGFITAGHLVDRSGVRVSVDATGPGGGRRVDGEVVCWQDPFRTPGEPGWDYAVVRLTDPADSVRPYAHNGPAPPPGRYPVVRGATVYRRMNTPAAVGTINGALAALGDDQRRWLNVWSFAPSGLLVRGDSGSVALRDDSTVLGHFVGGSGSSPASFDFQYIQDLQSCLADGLGGEVLLAPVGG